MYCLHCQASDTREYKKTTSYGYAIARCHGCERMLNERPGTEFNDLQFPTDVVLSVVLWRLAVQAEPERLDRTAPGPVENELQSWASRQPRLASPGLAGWQLQSIVQGLVKDRGQTMNPRVRLGLPHPKQKSLQYRTGYIRK